MLKINHEVEDDDRGGDRDPAGNSPHIEYTPAFIFSQQRNADGGCGKYNPKHERVDRRDAEITGPTLEARKTSFPPGRQHFRNAERKEKPHKKNKPDNGFNL